MRDKFTKAIILPWKSIAVAVAYQHFKLYDGIPIARTEERKQIRYSEWRCSDPTHHKLRDKFTKAIIFPWKSVAVAAVYQDFRLYDVIPIARTEEKKQTRCSEWRFSDPTHHKLRHKFTKAIIFPWKSGAVSAVYQHFRLYDGILDRRVQNKTNIFGVLERDILDTTHHKLRDKFTKAIIFPMEISVPCLPYIHIIRLYGGISKDRTEEKKQTRCSEWRFSDHTHQKLRHKFTKAIIFPWKSVALAAVYQHFRLYDGILIARTEENKQIGCSEWRISNPTHPTLRDKFTKAIIFPWKSVAVAAVYQYFRLYDGIPIVRTEEKKQIRCSRLAMFWILRIRNCVINLLKL